ncbi:MAG: thiamine pyrophosphate-binding protein [Thermoanaerobaculia bacterium]
MNGGRRVAEVLRARGIDSLFTLCGGHIAPILVEAKALGIRVVDVRHEASAVFAADATARLTGRPGVAVVTAGPGVTNTLTAIQNAALAESPVVLLGGATATVLRGRGALQDIDQLSLLRPLVKWAGRASRVADVVPLLEWALHSAQDGVPGPVFLELPVDLLYEEEIVRQWYGVDRESSAGLGARLQRAYVKHHLKGLFADGAAPSSRPAEPGSVSLTRGSLRNVVRRLARAERPLLLIGSQAALDSRRIGDLVAAVEELSVPCYLSGMARGLLGREHGLLLRHRRREALREADLVLLAGVPLDFRLDYGRQIPRRTPVVASNRNEKSLTLNRRPTVALHADPAASVKMLAGALRKTAGSGPSEGWADWTARLRQRDGEREAEIDRQTAAESGPGVGPLSLFRCLDRLLDDESVLVADGGDFVATASYTLRPRAPLSWLDPGVFGTLGVGGGFALAARACRPRAEVWLLWGDGSAGFSLAELDTCVRHRLPVIALVGNDASWAQIAREQVPMLGDAVGTELARTDYHRAAEGLGAAGLLVERAEDVEPALIEAKRLAAEGVPVLVNVHLAASDFRKGSLSM